MSVRKIKSIIFFVLEWKFYIILLMIPAFINGYPLLHPDLCRYITTSVDCWSPSVFPLLAYRIVSLSPWVHIIFQCSIASLVLVLFRRYMRLRFVAIVGLIVLSGYPYAASALIQDLYMPALLLALFLYLEGKGLGYLGVAALLCMAHTPFGLICGATLVLVLAARVFSSKKILLAMAVVVLCQLLTMYVVHKKYRTWTTPCQPAFLASRFLNDDPAFFARFEQNREESCFQIDMPVIEAMKRKADAGHRPDSFIWEKSSPIYFQKLHDCDRAHPTVLSASARELNAFVKSYVASHPLHLIGQLVENSYYFFAMPRTYNGTEFSRTKGFVYACPGAVRNPESLQENSAFNRYILDRPVLYAYWLSLCCVYAFVLGLGVRAVMATIRKRPLLSLTPERRFIVFAALFYLANGVITANLSTLDARYQEWGYPVLFIAAYLVVLQGCAWLRHARGRDV